MSAPCIYCGNPVNKKTRGEHIIPKAIGGKLCISDYSNRYVCGKCNHGLLSICDKELSSRSFVSIVASRFIDSSLWQTWDIDEQAKVLLEAKPIWTDDGEELSSFFVYPQILLYPQSFEYRYSGPAEDIYESNYIANTMSHLVRNALYRYETKGKGALHFERIESASFMDEFLYPPRVFFKGSFKDILHLITSRKRANFVVRYSQSYDRDFVLGRLSKLKPWPTVKQNRTISGSKRPHICVYFDIMLILRALVKIGINLLAAYSERTEVSHRSFSWATSFVLGHSSPRPEYSHQNGFVIAEDAASIASNKMSHCFRLTHDVGLWTLYCSFFGGRVGAIVRFPGPNSESWRGLHVEFPLDANEPNIHRSPIISNLHWRVEWNDQRKIIPDLRIQHAKSRIVLDA